MFVTPSKLFTRFVGFIMSVGLFSGFGIAEQVVDTVPHVVLEVGTRGILPCRIQRRGYSVEWKRHLSPETELLVSLDPLFIVGKRDGPGYEAGLFNITDDYSLVIKDVKVQDEGIYMCSFTDYKTGKVFQNSTTVSVQASLDEPSPAIQGCRENFVKPGVCTLAIHAPSNITCLATGYYPHINLFFLHGSENVASTDSQEWKNADGTKNKIIQIEASVSDEPYQCVASGLPGIGGNRSVSVIVLQARPEARSQAVLITAGMCLSIAFLFVKCYLRKGRVQISLKKVIGEEELKDICCQVLKQHYMYLVKAIGENHGEDLPYQLRKFVEENNASLFDALKMLHDWEQDKECSNYEKRNKLRKAVEAARQTNHTDAKWPPDDDLRVIASFISSASMEQLCSKIDIKSPPQEPSQEERFQALTEWRDNYASSKDLMEKRTELLNALKEVKRGGLIPRPKGPLVYKAELVDLAFHLFAQDLLPFTDALGISAAKLVAYRPTFQPSHMTQGTIGLVCKLFKSGERSRFLEIIRKIPYPNVFASGMLALEISFGEVCAISVNSANSQELKTIQASFTTSTSMPDGCDSFIATIEKNLISPEAKSTHGDGGIQSPSQNDIFDETASLLTSANQVENHSQVSAESSAFLKHYKVWRAGPRLSPFDFRLSLANRLRIEDYYHHMSDILRVNSTVCYNEKIIPFTFIHNILQTVDHVQREILGNLISDASFSTAAHYLGHFPRIPLRDDWIEMAEAVSDYLSHWTNNWILEMIFAKGEKGKENEIAMKHKEFNDKLVGNGFLDLAREIMISEQLPIDASRFTTVCEEPDEP